MVRKIRVTETRVLEYIPDYTEEFYSSLNVTNIEDALEADAKSIRDKDINIDELGPMVEREIKFEIVEVE